MIIFYCSLKEKHKHISLKNDNYNDYSYNNNLYLLCCRQFQYALNIKSDISFSYQSSELDTTSFSHFLQIRYLEMKSF